MVVVVVIAPVATCTVCCCCCCLLGLFTAGDFASGLVAAAVRCAGFHSMPQSSSSTTSLTGAGTGAALVGLVAAGVMGEEAEAEMEADADADMDMEARLAGE